MERFEDSSNLSDSLVLQHKKYLLLRAILWTNSIRVNEVCEDKIQAVVYLYEHQPEELTLNAEQKAFSKYLEDLKKRLDR